MRVWWTVWIGLCLSGWPAELTGQAAPEVRTVHVFVALCDNAHQGIAPVSPALGNGQDPVRNLYWGAAYGVRTYFSRQGEWERLEIAADSLPVRDRVLFRHRSGDTYLLAEAYDGAAIRTCTEDFLRACSGEGPLPIETPDGPLVFGGGAKLLAYVGHNGLMDFELDLTLSPQDSQKRQAIILGCHSQSYFQPWLRQTGAEPLLWTTGLMAPEAYVLEGALSAWRQNLAAVEVRRFAAEQYHRFQGCGIRAAWNLFRHGWE